ncbi:MAG: hypothetical protein LW835_07715 [Burkholderiaceae bacterium]|jgi:hypothetical protein|nr:hypothetical protein [Burkholderiaceae bacterium]
MSSKGLRSTDERGEQASSGGPEDLVVPALAALVLRQARRALFEDRMVAGVDKSPGAPVGLEAEDRRAMALVSRVCISRGASDLGAEIHELLYHCTLPLGRWLPLPTIDKRGLSETVLIGGDDGAPTAEAAELASGFSTVTAGVEELLFATFRDALDKQPKTDAYKYYSSIREFVVRNPLATTEKIKSFALDNDLPSALWMLVQQSFYEPIPLGWADRGQLALCAHCGNAMRPVSGAHRCRTNACSAAYPAESSESVTLEGRLRVRRGVHQYWVEPGVDEIRLFDELHSRGAKPDLYPYMDRVDIAVGDTGMDLKSYASPELLGDKIRRNKGGLNHYRHKWLVIPDWLVARTPGYLDRLRHALEEAAGSIRCLSTSEVLKAVGHA